MDRLVLRFYSISRILFQLFPIAELCLKHVCYFKQMVMAETQDTGE
jgi:hypothetical protein